MRAIYLALAAATVSLGFCVAIVGCNSSAIPPADTKTHEKMAGDNVGATADKKMGNDQMSSDKMSGGKMDAGKMSGDKMGGDKMDGEKKDKP